MYTTCTPACAQPQLALWNMRVAQSIIIVITLYNDEVTVSACLSVSLMARELKTQQIKTSNFSQLDSYVIASYLLKFK